MIALIAGLVVMLGPSDVPPPGHVELVVYDNDALRGEQACVTMLAAEAPGTSCRVVPEGPVLPTGPSTYTEYTDDPAAGAARCAEDVRRNPGSECDVASWSDYPGQGGDTG